MLTGNLSFNIDLNLILSIASLVFSVVAIRRKRTK
jgi:hypothetical protein